MINFYGQDWAAIKEWLLDSKKKKTGLLVSATDHDTSNKLRGAINLIDELLRLEDAAIKAATQRN